VGLAHHVCEVKLTPISKKTWENVSPTQFPDGLPIYVYFTPVLRLPASQFPQTFKRPVDEPFLPRIKED